MSAVVIFDDLGRVLVNFSAKANWIMADPEQTAKLKALLTDIQEAEESKA